MTDTQGACTLSTGSFLGDLKALSNKQKGGIILAVIVALLLEVVGFGATSCIGFLVVAVVLYMIPHLLKVMSVRVKALIGVAFLVLGVLIGTFAYGGIVDETEGLIKEDGDVIRNMDVQFDETVDSYVFTFEVNPTAKEYEGNWKVITQYGDLTMAAFGLLSSPRDIQTNEFLEKDLTTLSEGWYSGKLVMSELTEGKYEYVAVGVISVSEDNKEQVIASSGFTYDTGISTGDIYKINAFGALYSVGLAILMFFVILGFSALMRRSAEKTRAKMEADGRLYPQGYGRCKKCGAMVLPGEVVCRKCGEYIDVPDEMRAKKKDFVTCSECGSEVPGDADVCPKCGAKFDEEDETEITHADGTTDVTVDMVPCPHCAQDIPANATWCPKCGKKIKD